MFRWPVYLAAVSPSALQWNHPRMPSWPEFAAAKSRRKVMSALENKLLWRYTAVAATEQESGLPRPLTFLSRVLLYARRILCRCLPWLTDLVDEP
ncbi:hypothetical protein C8Q80DRAFT_1162951 [Daedaleopsis nitida]|nr:hypothetical protein C8Q80DRAFT_1162951 [Daedaleopsis nitida]